MTAWLQHMQTFVSLTFSITAQITRQCESISRMYLQILNPRNMHINNNTEQSNFIIEKPEYTAGQTYTNQRTVQIETACPTQYASLSGKLIGFILHTPHSKIILMADCRE